MSDAPIAGSRAPGPAESVWDYPRPPRVEPSDRHVRVIVEDTVVADTRRAVRVLETSHPPTWYIPPEDVRTDLLRPTSRHSACEFKGEADYFHVDAGGAERREAAWTYPRPLPGYEAIAGFIAFYAGRVDEAWVDGQRVMPQAGDFYGGWITPDVIGPFKGAPGTRRW